MKITRSEHSILRSTLRNHYGEDGDGVWAWAIASDSSEPSFVKGRSISGVVSSLVQKGLMGTEGKGADAWVWLTDAGCELAKSLGPVK